jgi:hypothetical protein
MSLRNGFLIIAAAGALAVGCATHNPGATAEITRARTLIEQAEKANAQQYAAVELDGARNKLREAESAAKQGDEDQAKARANEAAASAELASARASSAREQRAAEEVQRGNETLQREASRDTGTTPPQN